MELTFLTDLNNDEWNELVKIGEYVMVTEDYISRRGNQLIMKAYKRYKILDVCNEPGSDEDDANERSVYIESEHEDYPWVYDNKTDLILLDIPRNIKGGLCGFTFDTRNN